MSSSLTRVAQALRGAAPGNLVRFLAPDGVARWGALEPCGSTLGPRRAFPLEGDLLSSLSVDLMAPGLGSGTALEVAELLPPLPVYPPPAIVCLGLNYKAHAAEAGHEIPRFPVIFYKSPASVAGPGASVEIPACARQAPEVDFEAELALVVGRQARDIKTAAEAFGCLLGITAANDVSARRWQGKKGGGQWSRAKSFDRFCPVGPSLAPLFGVGGAALMGKLAAEGPGLRLRSVVNGQEMQQTMTNDMIFSVVDIMRFLSEGTTLLPGTLILTGTPSGVGYARSPPVFLNPGDQVDIELEDVGVLSNTFA